MTTNPFRPIVDAPIGRTIIVRRGPMLARVRWHRVKNHPEGGFWKYDVPDEDYVERIDFAPTHWRELQPAKKERAHVNA